jgi:rubrerythrin
LDRPFVSLPGTILFGREHDRRAFLRLAALVGVGAATALAPFGTTQAASPSPKPLQFGQGDPGILRYALALEYLQAEFYARGVQSGTLGTVAPIVTPIAQHEAAHVNLITDTLAKIGEQALAKPTFKFSNSIFSASTNFLKAASVFEEAGVKAYQGQVTNVKDKTLLGAAAAIAGTESRHAAVIGYLLSKQTLPGATEPRGTMAEIMAIVQPYLG